MRHGVCTEVVVQYRERDGWHVFTCDALLGLYVASQDRRKAFSDLPEAIRKLLKLDHGIDCVVSHKLTYEEFVKRNWLTQRAQREIRQRTDQLVREGTNEIPFILEQLRADVVAAG